MICSGHETNIKDCHYNLSQLNTKETKFETLKNSIFPQTDSNLEEAKAKIYTVAGVVCNSGELSQAKATLLGAENEMEGKI